MHSEPNTAICESQNENPVSDAAHWRHTRYI